MPLRFLTAGESHGPALIAVIDGLPAGLKLDVKEINQELFRRQQGFGAGARMKIEHDTAIVLGGVMEGLTTGAPLAIEIRNLDHQKWRGKSVKAFTTPRPGHADLTGAIKYGFHDLRPALERASARETAARVAVGAVCKALLGEFGIRIGGYVISIGEIQAPAFDISDEMTYIAAEESPVRCPDAKTSDLMIQKIRHVMENHNTLGGVIEIAARGVPPGLGSYAQWDRRLEARLGAALLSVPAIKGLEIGPAFENTTYMGTAVHDSILLQGDNLIRHTNRAGGIEGGITNGEPIVIRAAMKPIATTLAPQQTVDLGRRVATDTHYERSDFCPVPRAVPILEAMVAYIIADALIEKIGGDSLAEMHPRFTALRRAKLSDLPMEGEQHLFWGDEGTIPSNETS